MKQLIVGDPHVTVEELDDATALMELVYRLIVENEVEELVVLGDLHNNFAITNVKVTGFWYNWLRKIKTIPCLKRIILLKGNHDMMGDGSDYPHALIAYEGLATVVDKSWCDYGALYLPFIANPNLFIAEVAKYPDIKMIYCHQEFNGVMYDNGFYAPNGADPNLIQVPTISGHIHTSQTLGKIWYPGAPRWRTLSDANVDRSVVLIERTEASYKILKHFSTSEVCRRIWAFDVLEQDPQTQDLPPPNDKDEFRMRVEGSAPFAKEMEKKLRQQYPRVRISTVITDKVIRVRESDGIDVAFKKFLDSFPVKNGTPISILKDLALHRLYDN